MTSRERLGTVLSGGVPDRVPYQDTFWATTVERWHREGLPSDVKPAAHFGCEMSRFGGDYSLQLPRQEVELTDRYHVYVDENGATRKDLATADGWTPGWLGFTINGKDDWFRMKERGTYNPSRIPKQVTETYSSARSKDLFVVYSAHACFHPTWQKIGMETLLIEMIEDPDFISDMYATHTQMIIDLYDGIKALGIEYDAAWLSDDLGYRNAPLVSPEMYRDLIMPHHRAACEHFAEDGLKTILHSDGDVRPLIPYFLEAGFSALHPLEAKASLDVRDLKPTYGDRLVLFGNIDVRQLADTRESIEEEVRVKVGSGKEGGGYIWHSDHSVPNDVSLDNYRFALEMLERYGRYD